MRAFNRERHMEMGSKAAGKPRAGETSATPHRSKVRSNAADKSAENPNHREDFNKLLRSAIKAQPR